MNSKVPTFWGWFLRGTGERPGYKRLVDWWLLVHVAVGFILATVVAIPLQTVAEKSLLPLMAIFVGLTFSWAGNAHSLMQSDEILVMGQSRSGGIAEYVFTFQLCIFVMLVAIGLWVVPILQIPYIVTNASLIASLDYVSKVALYSVLALSLRICWAAVNGANLLLLARVALKDAAKERARTRNTDNPDTHPQG